MIPVYTMDKHGDMSYQVFNDNLTVVEQINRKMLYAITYAQQKLVNSDFAVSRKIAKADVYDDAKLAEINAAADELVKAISAAVDAFDAATVVAPVEDSDDATQE